MLQIALALGAASPLGLAFHHLRPVLSALWTVLRLAWAALAAVFAYGVSMTFVTVHYEPHRPLAAMIYASGLAVATLIGICTATLAAPGRLARHIIPSASALSVLLPAAMFIRTGTQPGWEGPYVLYAVGAFTGCVAGTRLMVWAKSARLSPSSSPG